MKDHTTRCEFEARTHAIMEFDIADSQTTVMVKNVWKAMYSSALPAKRVRTIAEAINNVTFREDDAVQKELTRMVRAKMLRSYSNDGRRFYEVNY